jgi:cyclopropane-fatty-acyl-phospholipid synthase
MAQVIPGWIKEGGLAVRLPGGRVLLGGCDSVEAAPVVVVIADMATAWRVVRRPRLALGEAYMEGTLRLERGSLWDLLELIGRNRRHRSFRKGPLAGLRRRIGARLQQANARRAARRNVAHHYDLSLELYRRFLDEDLQYSCAYFAEPDLTLEQAQAAKKRHLAGKLLLRPGQKVLDIGSGWGGLALTLAQEAEVQVTGVTLSTEQLRLARERAQRLGLAGPVRFELKDYRDVDGPFDRIVSVGMFEHVGAPNYEAFFRTVAGALADDGVAVIHTIGRSHGPEPPQPWIAKYIFPGGYIPSLSEISTAVERSGLVVTDVEVWRLHYAETLRCWRERFMARREEIAALYDERFCRMWEFYLAASEMSFRFNGHVVFQVQLAKRQDAVPLTRDYITDYRRKSLGADDVVAA